jgi:hypothetical protein
MFNLVNEPWPKYNMGAVADRGLKPHEWTSARLKSAVAYLESHTWAPAALLAAMPAPLLLAPLAACAQAPGPPTLAVGRCRRGWAACSRGEVAAPAVPRSGAGMRKALPLPSQSTRPPCPLAIPVQRAV